MMFQYLLIFVMTLILSFLVEPLHVKRTISQIGLSIVIAAPMTIGAGLRTADIGTDIQIYGLPNFLLAMKYSDFNSYSQNLTTSGGIEFGYAVLNFLVSRVTGNLNILLFVIAILTYVPVVLATLRLRNLFSISATVQICLFYCMFYGFSLNLLRQGIAIAFSFLALSFFLYENDTRSRLIGYILVGFAILFHRSAIVVVPLILFLFPGSFRSVRYGKILNLCRWILLIIISVFLIKLITAPNSSYVIKYSRYLGINGESPQGGQSPLKTIQLIVFPIIALISFRSHDGTGFLRSLNEEDGRRKLSKFNVSMILVVDILLQIASTKNVVVGRIGLFVRVLEIFLLPLSSRPYVKKSSDVIFNICLVLYYLTAFILFTKNGFNGIYPYKSIMNFS